MNKKNFDQDVVDDFGDEWEAYDYSSNDSEELEKQFLKYYLMFYLTSVLHPSIYC